MTPALERRLLQIAVAVAGVVPVTGGGLGVLGHLDRAGHAGDGHVRYLSGLLLGLGLVFWTLIPTLERQGRVVRVLAAIVFIGGLARLGGSVQHGFSPMETFALCMELAVTPAIALWRERVERRL